MAYLSYEESNLQDEGLKKKKLLAFISYWVIMLVFTGIIARIYSLIVYGTYNTEFVTNPDLPQYTRILSASNFYVYLIITLVIILLLRTFFLHEITLFKEKPGYIIGLGVAFYGLGFISLIVVSSILQAAGITDQTSNNQSFIETMLKQYPFYTVVVTIIFAPIVEEVIFRGIVFSFFEKLNLKYRLNTVLAFVVSSSFFGLIHVTDELFTNFGRGLLLGLPYITLGLVMATVFYLTKSLFASIITHFIQNFISIMMSLLLIYNPDLLGETTGSLVTFMSNLLKHLF